MSTGGSALRAARSSSRASVVLGLALFTELSVDVSTTMISCVVSRPSRRMSLELSAGTASVNARTLLARRTLLSRTTVPHSPGVSVAEGGTFFSFSCLVCSSEDLAPSTGESPSFTGSFGDMFSFSHSAFLARGTPLSICPVRSTGVTPFFAWRSCFAFFLLFFPLSACLAADSACIAADSALV